MRVLTGRLVSWLKQGGKKGASFMARGRGFGGQPDKRIVILGGGFGGIYTALGLERTLRPEDRTEVTLISAENFFLFTPMLCEVASSSIDTNHAINPIRRMFKRIRASWKARPSGSICRRAPAESATQAVRSTPTATTTWSWRSARAPASSA